MRVAAPVVLVVGLVSLAVAQNPASQPAQPPSAPHAHASGGDMPSHMRMMNDTMLKYLGQKDPDYEKRFIDLMIPHHEGALLAAKHALANANRPELKEMAQKMIEAQQKEIEQLKKWRHEWHGNP